jgi:hypothetical protein
MTSVTHPDYDTVLDWQIEVEHGEKPLRYLDVDDLLLVAAGFAFSEQHHLAATYTALAKAVEDDASASAVEDLAPDVFNATFWAIEDAA